MTGTLATCRVLLVDDEPILRSLLALMLRRTERYEVVGEAGDGLEALALASDHSPDLVLLDLSMPRMDGLETLPHLRRMLPDTHVIVLSGFTATGAADAAYRAGAHAYLEKGLDPTALMAAIDEAVARPA